MSLFFKDSGVSAVSGRIYETDSVLVVIAFSRFGLLSEETVVLG